MRKRIKSAAWYAVLFALLFVSFGGLKSTHAQTPSDLIDLTVVVELQGALYNVPVGRYDRFSADDVARDVVNHGFHFMRVSPQANYYYAPSMVRYVAYQTVPTP